MKLPIQHRIVVEGVFWSMHQHVLDACRIGNRVLVISDYTSFGADRQARNLNAYDLKHKILWTAEHPTTSITDTYVRFMSEVPLKVSNFAGYICEIDVETGKLLSTESTK